MNNTIAIKALNQYRKRDIWSYLGLRYYLENKAGRQNRWIQEVSTRLTRDSLEPCYLKTFHFKDFKNGEFEHRVIHLPAPNEALAEVALISELTKHESFNPKSCVYSYRFPCKKEGFEVFQQYFKGFKDRHLSIGAACEENCNGVVLYTDIKKFYPSIKSTDALNAWKKACETSKLSKDFCSLGTEILKKHEQVSQKDNNSKGILTGPLFSHVIANLLLDSVDVQMSKISNGKYWRYVDDVVFVGTQEEVCEWRTKLAEHFSSFGLDLHEGSKDFQVLCKDWLEGVNDFDNNLGREWICLISDVKRFLLANSSKSMVLQQEFKDNHIRIPIVDYTSAIEESNYLQHFQGWLGKYKWAKYKVKSITIKDLLYQAKQCEKKLKIRLDEILVQEDSLSEFDEKRVTPKLRYLIGRLLYLLSNDDLIELYPKLNKKTELYLLAETVKAIATKDVTDILNMGVNATHGVAQLLRAEQAFVTINDNNIITPVFSQSLAVLKINDIQHDIEGHETELHLLAQGKNLDDLMMSNDRFIKEFACLHGNTASRHKSTLDSAFDRNEALSLDILDQMQQSNYR